MNKKLEEITNKIASAVNKDNVDQAAIVSWKFLQENGGIDKLEMFLDSLRIQLAKQKGLSVIEAITAQKLSRENKDKLEKKLSDVYGKDILFVFKTDERLGGGIVIKKDNEIIDKSWRGKLRTLKSKLAGNI